MMGKLNFDIFCLTHSTESNREMAILALRKGMFSRSSKMPCSFLLFLVSAVGFIIALMMRSSRSSPSFCTTNSLALGKCLSEGRPRNGLVMMQPLTRISLLCSSSFMLISAPMLCAYRKSGSSACAWHKSVITSFCIIYTVEHARGPPEYPKPVKSISST